MSNSNDRKLALSGWLKKYNPSEYAIPLKFQKFLLLYELFTKIAGEKADFDYLKGYRHGPVFSNVWGDYTKERAAFDKEATKTLARKESEIDLVRAKQSAFIVSVLNETDLSELTHRMNLWNSKRDRILSGEHQVALDESDFTEEDADMITLLGSMYPISLIETSVIVSINQFYFVFNSENAKKFTEAHSDYLATLIENENLHNPIFVEIDDDGRLIID